MPNKKQDKKKAQVNQRKLSFEEKKEEKRLKKNKIITDEETTEEEKEEEKKELKKSYNYPKDELSYDSLISTDKTDEINNKTRKRKGKGKENKSQKKKKSTTAIKQQKKKYVENINDDYISDYKEEEKRINIKNKEDIEMRDDTEKKNKLKNSLIINNNYLPCREKEQEIIYNYIKKGLETNGNYNSLYIAGMPGTGKTACVTNVIKVLEEELNKDKKNNKKIPYFTKLFISGTEFPFLKSIYTRIYNFIFDENVTRKKRGRKKRKNYIQKLDSFFRDRELANTLYLNDSSNSHIILVVDEIDFLINKGQNMLYNLFNWTTYDYSKLIVISISNTLDLPDHLLPKIKSRMGNNKLMFKPYNKDELMDIINYKGINYNNFSPDAIKLCCMKVSAINGDLRRTFQILLRAKELFNLESTRNSKYKKIDKNYIIKACDDLFNSKLRKVIESLQICEKIVICAILSKIKDNNDNKVNLGNIYDKLDIFFDKYNENGKNKLELYWEEYKAIIYNLIRLQLLIFCENQKINFMENNVTIKFYIDEFIIACNACDNDKNFKNVLNYLTNLLSI